MGFDIGLTWRQQSPDPVERNRNLATSLLSLPGLSEFPLDHPMIAASLGVPEAQVLEHWPQIELNADARFLEAIITLWLDRAYIELPSTPPVTCEEALALLRPLLDTLDAAGLRVADPDRLLVEYEAQRVRVTHVAEITGGRAY